MIHEQAHADKWERLVLFAFTITSQIIRFLKFEKVVGAIVVKDIPAPFNNFLAVFVKFCLDEVIFFGEYGKSPVNVVQFKGRLFEEGRGLPVSRQLR